jgi:signal transduction histidine kinase
VSNLSHQLHSSELELLGLSAAVNGLCREFSDQYHIQVDCACSGIPNDLDNDVALGLFRVTQEALHNVAKHSQAKSVSIDLRVIQKRLCLTLLDDGIGFESDDANNKGGLGLVSMRERMLLIGGDFEISSRSGAGTRIEASAPFPDIGVIDY